ncbi:MAG: 50S ribosomal protein L6 [Rhodospirillales bacterium]|nr:50S ribosomal protein L6 [Rhodospirillales bacterium]
MSRIGKNPVTVPSGVDVQISGQQITAKGKLGQISRTFVDDVVISREGDQIWVKPSSDSSQSQKMWGTMRSMLSNMITGVSEGFTRNLEVNGVGYRAQVQGKDLILQLGYSHEVRFPIPEGVTIQCPEQTKISLSGADKQKVGQAAAVIRRFRPPEPYKGKGIKYDDELIVRKEGKKK